MRRKLEDIICIYAAMASYNPRNNDFLKDTLIVGLINSITSIFSGFAIFSVLGYIAYVQHKDVAEVNITTVEPRYKGPASTGNPPITEAILRFLEVFFFT